MPVRMGIVSRAWHTDGTWLGAHGMGNQIRGSYLVTVTRSVHTRTT